MEYSKFMNLVNFGKMVLFKGFLPGLLLFSALSACSDRAGITATEGVNDMGIQLTSKAFKEGDFIPRVYTCDDKNVSPPLEWIGVPGNTTSLAIIMDDPDAPAGTWVHWVVYNLPGNTGGLEQGSAGRGTEGKNDFNRTGYGGPCPPRNSNHRYFVRIYALDTTVDLKAGASKSQLERVMQGHILAQGQLMGRYGR